MFEWPLEKAVEVALADDEVETEVRVAAHAVAVEVETRAHLVAGPARVEGVRIDARHAASLRLLAAASDVTDAPQQHAVIARLLCAKKEQCDTSHKHTHAHEPSPHAKTRQL